MAARRERERRRPGGERRYRFEAPPEPALETDETQAEANGEATEALERPAPARPSRTTLTQPRGVARSAPKPFSAYREEYAYVYGDLRRVAAVIGSLLVALIVLYFVLPLLVH